MINVQKINKYFGDFRALNDISFEVGKGEIVGFLGQNGAGKTTLMRILTSYYLATSGKVEIDGKDIVKHSLLCRKKIGYLPENPPLYMNLTVRDYLKYSASLKDVEIKKQKLQVDKVIDSCSLKDVQNKNISILSKGYKQRVGIAQSIINDPQVLILDEPTIGLDPLQILQVRQLIKRIEDKRTVIISTHILSEIEQIARRVLVIKNGEILIDRPISALLDKGHLLRFVFVIKGDKAAIEKVFSSSKEIIKESFESTNDVHSVKVQVLQDWTSHNELIQKIMREKAELVEIRKLKPSLEEVFINRVERE